MTYQKLRREGAPAWKLSPILFTGQRLTKLSSGALSVFGVSTAGYYIFSLIFSVVVPGKTTHRR
jgi:hypothetical protein